MGSNKLRPYFKQFDSDGIFHKVVRLLLIPNSAYRIYLLKNDNGEYAAFWLIGFNNLDDFEVDSTIDNIDNDINTFCRNTQAYLDKLASNSARRRDVINQLIKED